MVSRKELRLIALLIAFAVVIDVLSAKIQLISVDVTQSSPAAASATGGEAKTTDDCPMPNQSEHKGYWEKEPHNTTFKKKDETGKEVEHTNYWGKPCTETKPPSQTMTSALRVSPGAPAVVGTGYCAIPAHTTYPECKLTKCRVGIGGEMKPCSKETVADKDGTIGAPKEEPVSKDKSESTPPKKDATETTGKDKPATTPTNPTDPVSTDKPGTVPTTDKPSTPPTETAGQVDNMLKNPAATDGGGAAASPGVGAGEGSATVGGGPSPTDKVTQVVDAGGGQGGTQQGSGSASTQPTTGTGPVQQLPQPSVSPGSSLSSQYGTMSTPASSATQQGSTQQSSRDIIADASRAPSSPSTFSSSQQQPAPYQPSQGGSSYGQQGVSSYGGGSPSFGSAVANFFGAAVSTVVSTAGSVSSALPSPTQVVSAFTPAPTQTRPQMQQPVMLAPAYSPTASTASATTQQSGPGETSATQGSATTRGNSAIGLGQGQQGGGVSTQLTGLGGTLSLQDSIPILEGYTEPSLLLSGEVDAGRKVSTLLRSAGVVARDDRTGVTAGRTAQGVASALGRETQNTPVETGTNERSGSAKRPDTPSMLERAAEDRDTASFVEAVRGIQEKLFTQGVDAAARDTWRYFQEHVGCQLSGGCADEGSITIVGRVPLLVNAEAIKSSFAAYGEKLPSPTVVAQLHIDLSSQPTIAARAGVVLGSIGQGLRALSTNIFGLFGITQRALPTDVVAGDISTQAVHIGTEFVPNTSASQERRDTQAGQVSPGETRGIDAVTSGYAGKNDTGALRATTSISESGQVVVMASSVAETVLSASEARRAPSVAEVQASQQGMFGTVLTQTNKVVVLFVERMQAVIAQFLSFLF